jgi:hypothetical protein
MFKGDDTQGAFHEEGVNIAEKNGKQIIVPSKPGSAKVPADGENAINQTFTPADPNLGGQNFFKGGLIKISVHIHPAGTGSAGLSTTSYTGEPGSGDKPAHALGLKYNLLNANSYSVVVGAGDNRMSLYNDKKVIMSMTYSSFLKIYGIEPK